MCKKKCYVTRKKVNLLIVIGEGTGEGGGALTPTCFESLFPAVEVHGCEFVVVGVGHEGV